MPHSIFDNSISFNELRKANVKRCEHVFHKLGDWTLTDWATALAGELGEACNIIKKLRRLDGADKAVDTPETRAELLNKLAEELADTQIYLDLTAAAAGIDLGESTRAKFNLVSEQRKSDIEL